MFKATIFFISAFLTSSLLAQENNYSSARKSKLKLNLVGTIVYSEDRKSIASINSGSYFINEEVKETAEVLQISRLKVYIKNLNNNKIEYITTGKYIKSKAVNNADVFQSKKSEYHIDRKLIDKVTSDLPSFLKDAGTNFVKDKNGNIIGFEMTFIKKGGIFDTLGFEVGDMINEVNGLKFNSIQSGLKMYKQLRGSSIINIKMKRNGKTREIKYLAR